MFFFQLRVSPTHHKLQNFYKQVQIASLFASFLNMLPRASAAGVSAFTYQSIDFYTNTPYGKRNHFAPLPRTIYACQLLDRCRLPKKHEPASGVAAGVSAAYRFCTSKITIKSDLYPSRNIFWPYTLQPPRRQEFQPASQLSPIVTNTVPWIICESFVPFTAKYTLKALWFVFALKSLEEPEQQNMTTFTVVVLSNHVWKSSQLLPARVALPMHLPMIFYTGVKVQKYDKVRIPLATKTYLQSSCWSSICGLAGLLFPALVLATNPKTSLNMFTCASLFASFLNMLPRASAAGVSAFTYQSIDQTNTPYS